MKMTCLHARNSSFYLLIVCSSLISCVSTRGFHGETATARDRDRKAFVQTKDGTVTEANETVVRTPLFKQPFIELDKSVKIPTKDVVAYQNSQAYYRRIDLQFAPRIKKGLINMYKTVDIYQDYSGPSAGSGRGGGRSTKTRIVYHLQKGDDAAVERFSPAVAQTYVQDYAPSKELMETYAAKQKGIKVWSVVNTAAVVGGFLMMGQGTQRDAFTPVAYAGVGLFVGGLVNGVVNKVRKRKNFSNIELAIDEYNRQLLKNRKR